MPKEKKILSKEQSERTEHFIDILKNRSLTKLYEDIEDKDICVNRNLTKPTFYRLIERMREGIGLYGDPELLSCVLNVTGISADVLYRDTPTIPIQAIHAVLDTGTTQTFQEVLHKCFQAEKKIIKQATFQKKWISSFATVTIAEWLLSSNNENLAGLYLFNCHSAIKPNLYPHGRVTGNIEIIDQLCKYLLKAKKEAPDLKIVGLLLINLYCFFEFDRFCSSFIYYANLTRKMPEYFHPPIKGFIYTEDMKNELTKILSEVWHFFATEVNNITSNNPRDLSTSSMKNAAYQAIKLVKIFHSLNSELNIDGSSGDKNEDFLFDLIVGLKPTLKLSFSLELNKDFLNGIESYFNQLTAVNHVNTNSINAQVLSKIYINCKSNCQSPDGLCWDTAFQDIEAALTLISKYSNDERDIITCFIAQGTYEAPKSGFEIPNLLVVDGNWINNNTEWLKEKTNLKSTFPKTILHSPSNGHILFSQGVMTSIQISEIAFQCNQDLPTRNGYFITSMICENTPFFNLINHLNFNAQLDKVPFFASGFEDVQFNNCAFYYHFKDFECNLDNQFFNKPIYTNCTHLDLSSK